MGWRLCPQTLSWTRGWVPSGVLRILISHCFSCKSGVFGAGLVFHMSTPGWQFCVWCWRFSSAGAQVGWNIRLLTHCSFFAWGYAATESWENLSLPTWDPSSGEYRLVWVGYWPWVSICRLVWPSEICESLHEVEYAPVRDISVEAEAGMKCWLFQSPWTFLGFASHHTCPGLSACPELT